MARTKTFSRVVTHAVVLGVLAALAAVVVQLLLFRRVRPAIVGAVAGAVTASSVILQETAPRRKASGEGQGDREGKST